MACMEKTLLSSWHARLCMARERKWCGVAWQVTRALNEAETARHEVPYAFIQHLVHAPAALQALHSSLKAATGISPLAQNC